MNQRWIILDVASAAIADAASYIDKSAIEAPGNYKSADAISNYIEKEYANRIARAGLDLDLARITAIGAHGSSGYADAKQVIYLCHDEAEEIETLKRTAASLADVKLITYGGFHFDLPFLMRRARYLGVDFPKLNLDRYKSPHVDLLLELSDRDPSRRRSLSFYVKRLGFTDLAKPLSGEEEAQVFTTGKWDELRASVAHDVEATRRIAAWMGVL